MITTPYGHTVYAMAAEYPSAAALYEAAKHVRDAGFRRWDVYSTFPIQYYRPLYQKFESSKCAGYTLRLQRNNRKPCTQN